MNRRNLLIGIGSIILLVTAYLIINALSHIGKINITLAVSPTDSTITMDNKPISTGSIWINAGMHEFKASHKYFDDATLSVDTSKIDTKKTIYVLPNPNSAEAKQWLIDHPKDQAIREAAGNIKAEEINKKIVTDFPIANSLPYTTLDFQINYSGYNSETKKLGLLINLYAIINNPNQAAQYKAQLQKFKTEALKWLTDNGVDLKNTDITYIPNPDAQ